MVAVNVVNKKTQTPADKQVTFSKVNLAGEEIAGAQIQIFKGREARAVLSHLGLQKLTNLKKLT